MKYQVLLITLILFASCNRQIKQANKRGLEYMKQNQYENAVAEFNQILNQDVTWFPAYYNRGVSYANMKQYKEALQDFNYVLRTYPDHAEAYFNRAIVYENLGIYSSAIKDYSETVKLRPDFIMAYHYRGIVRFKMNDFNGALADYNQALALGQNVKMDAATAKEYGLNASALYFNRAAVLQKQGKHEEAIKDYTEAIQIDPSNAKSYYNRAIARLALSLSQEALEDLQIASRLGYEQADQVIRAYFQ